MSGQLFAAGAAQSLPLAVITLYALAAVAGGHGTAAAVWAGGGLTATLASQ